jgi:hypothetical protein
MADLTINNTATLTGAGLASGDLFPLLDVSASAGSQGSKITRDELRIGLGITGGGTLATAGYTLTLPATGTAVLLGTANVFTVAQTFASIQATSSANTCSFSNVASLGPNSNLNITSTGGAGVVRTLIGSESSYTNGIGI